MFLKQLRTKSNVQLKSSERKKLHSKVQSQFNCDVEQLSELFPSKSPISQLKVVTHSNEIVTVYAVDRRPMFFETPDNILLPTVYSLWLIPTLVPYFTTHPDVLARMANGADLMLPGILRQGHGSFTYGRHNKGDLMAVNLTSNRSAVAIGILPRSSDDMYMSGGHGVAIKILHVFGDKLWSIEPSVSLQVPVAGAIVELPKKNDFPVLGVDSAKERKPETTVARSTYAAPNGVQNQPTRRPAENDQFPPIGGNPRKPKPPKAVATIEAAPIVAEPIHIIEDKLDDVTIADDDVAAEPVTPEEGDVTGDPVGNMDDTLRSAFLTALKRDGKKLSLPLLTSTLYRCNIVPATTKQIDLKQSSYKKLSKFLQAMVAEGFITIKEEQKGVEKLHSINFEHPSLVNFILEAIPQDTTKGEATSLFVTEMTELYLVTEETAAFFTTFDMAIGEGIEAAQIKKFLKDYVIRHKLQMAGDSRRIILDDTLATICQLKAAEIVEVGDLLHTIIARMVHSYEMRRANQVKSGNRPNIQMSLATRSGNKKVTFVSNLALHGIKIPEFAKACKLGVAASTTLIQLPGMKGDSLLVQGNQIRFITNLLTDTYKVPAKNISGVELARKEKKQKKKK